MHFRQFAQNADLGGMDINRETLAISRLRAWSDPKAKGSPTKRLMQIWPNPIEMARDIHALLEKVGK